MLFNDALTFVLGQEGGVSNHPKDRGGLTNRGITQDTYDEYRRSVGMTTRRVTLMESEEAPEIYLKIYWKKAGCEHYVYQLALPVFDFAVNSGVQTAVTYLQRSLWIKEDGIAGRDTIRAATAQDWRMTVWALLTLRRQKYRGIIRDDPEQIAFLNGWLNRLKRLRDEVYGVKGQATLVEVK